MSNTTIGAYRIVRQLGQGGMGEVLLAYDERLERLVAIKRIRPELAASQAQKQRFRREARAVAQLSHPNIVPIFDILIGADGGDGIVMEYVEGRSLAELLRSGPLPLAQVVGFGEQIARGLGAAHDQGLIHRDLKASNVVVSKNGEAKILDFGLAKSLLVNREPALTEDGALLGTYRAMSPEQARGEEVDERSDLFSLGVLLYEMVSGKSPFQGETPALTLSNLLHQAPPGLPPQLPVALADLIRALLSKDRATRPQSAAEVAAALHALLPPTTSPLPPELASPGGWPDPRQWHSTLGEKPTGLHPLPRQEALTPQSSGRHLSWVRAHPGWTAFVGLALLALLAVISTRQFWPPAQTLRVAIVGPREATSDFAASGVTVEILRSLLALAGLVPLDPALTQELRGNPVEIARAVAADEVLSANVVRQGQADRIALERVLPDGSVVWAESITVPNSPLDALIGANAITAALRRAYPGRQLRPGVPDLDVRAQDYATFLQIHRQVDGGRVPLAPELTRLEALTAMSPKFVDGQVFTALLALSLYDDTKDLSYLDRAGAALARARTQVSSYPPLLGAEIRLALAEGRHRDAEAFLAQLAAEQPGDPRVPLYRARLADSQGQLGQAIAELRAVIGRTGTWLHLLRLSDLEIRAGEISAAREHLQAGLELAPGNPRLLTKLGQLELLYGDLPRAATIYGDLTTADHPHRSDFSNLGLVHYLLGNFAAAAASHRQALALQPDHWAVLINLADAELARGQQEVAQKLYQQALSALENLGQSSPLKPAERLSQAQCLLHLGQRDRAVELAIEGLQAAADEGWVVYQVALVLALAGEKTTALVSARKALELGIEPRWFSTPGFASLRQDPAFRALLASASAPAPK